MERRNSTQGTETMVRHMWHVLSGTSTSVAGLLMLANTNLAAALKAFVALVLCLLVNRTARALGPFVDETGRLLRDCVAYLRKGLRRLFT